MLAEQSLVIEEIIGSSQAAYRTFSLSGERMGKIQLFIH